MYQFQTANLPTDSNQLRSVWEFAEEAILILHYRFGDRLHNFQY